jgi:hypothetical protein
MGARAKKRLSFTVVVWALVGLGAFMAVLGPLVQNGWARVFWHQVPCWAPGGRFFFYDVGKQRYSSDRKNFWQAVYHTVPVPSLAASDRVEPNDKCWVSPGQPSNVVLRLDPPPSLSEGANRYMTLVLLVGGAGILTYAARRRRLGAKAAGGTANHHEA